LNRIPFVIDNVAVKLADVLNDLLAGQQQPQLDIATAYFSVRGFELVRATLPGVRHLRLLLGDILTAGACISGAITICCGARSSTTVTRSCRWSPAVLKRRAIRRPTPK
jgi:hypothetical protein